MARDFYIAPAGSGTSGTGTSRKNPIVGLSSVNNNAIGAGSGDRLIFLPGTHYEQFVVPSNGLTLVSEDTIWDGSLSLNGTNTLNNSYVEVSGSAWQLVNAGSNIWKKGHKGTWNVYLNGEWIEPMPSSLAANSEVTIIGAIGVNEWTISTAVNTDAMGATLYLRLPTGTNPNTIDIRCSHTRRYNVTGSTSIMAGAIEAVGKTNLDFYGNFTVRRVNNSAGHRVNGFYFEQCVGLTNVNGQFSVKNCFVPLRIAGGDSVKVKFKVDYCNSAVAIQNSNEATAVAFAKAGTIEIFDWESNYCGWMPRYDGTQVNSNNDADGGVGVGYNGGDITKVIIRDGVCLNGGPSVLTLKTGWIGSVGRGSGVNCSTSIAMNIDELVVSGNRIENTSRTGIATSGTGIKIAKKSIIGNLIVNTRPIPIATNTQSSIISAIESSGQLTATDLIIANNTIIGGSYTASGIYVDRVHANSTCKIYNNIIKDVSIEGGYTNYGAIQLAESTNLTINNNINDNSGSGIIGRIVNTNYTSFGTWQGAGYDVNGINGTVTIATNGAPSAGTANPIGTGFKYWGNNARPVGIDGNPFPDTNIDIGCFQTSTSLTHPVNIVGGSNIHTSENLYNLIQSLTTTVTNLSTKLDAIEGFKFSPSIYSAEVLATTLVTGQSEVAATGATKLQVVNQSLVNSVYIGIGGTFLEAESNCSAGWAGSTRHMLLPNTSAIINLDDCTHFAWVSSAGTATVKITQGV